ncbi:TetR family transcriptional regulator [Streptomyces sp. NBRC 110611]|uniref:TetR/AcrR family transcriptional regulator n=1 Tax=Streptomyces sp. NBRC 110611 TaxID=1621259 RepID=UPI0008589937|nr:TetR/AcrR family transcriptional regulator [Streptomyces sp. NBRC 110611]GAU66949.1 TetR family transcriptional regulator [Streptomyces sp. NBRC 110611]
MPSEEPTPTAPAPGERSAAALARRAQIIAATTDTIAALGYRRTTFARIAERGGLSSTRLISYHFANKDELVKAVVADVFDSIDRFLLDRAAADPANRPIRQPADAPPPRPHTGSAAAELRAYITGTVAFVDSHRTRMRALASIFAALHDDEEHAAAYDTDTFRDVLGHLQGILRRGQARGEFRSCDTFVMAAAIQNALSGLPFLLRTRPDLNLPAYAEELATLFGLATRA